MIRSLLVAAAALALLAPAAAAADSPDAEIFATDNTALITDPDDPRLDDPLTRFARTVERIVDRGGGEPRARSCSTACSSRPTWAGRRSNAPAASTSTA